MPIGGIMPIFPPARYLLGLPPDEEFEVRDLMVKVAVRLTYLDDPPRAFPGVQQEIYYRSFARMLAKIAHCQAVAALGLDGFEPALAEIIRGKIGNGLSLLVAFQRHSSQRIMAAAG